MSTTNAEDQVRMLLPIEIVGNHWVYRKKDDADAIFYLKVDVDRVILALALRIQQLSDRE